MQHADHHRNGLEAIDRFGLAIRHCPKCGWTGPATDAVLRYCGPDRRVGTEWHEEYPIFGVDGEWCGLDGEHFHRRCARCHHRRMLPVAGRGWGEVN